MPVPGTSAVTSVPTSESDVRIVTVSMPAVSSFLPHVQAWPHNSPYVALASEFVSVEYGKFPRSKHETNNFHSCTVHLDTIKVFYLPTDAQ
jgi:hypothetical protein